MTDKEAMQMALHAMHSARAFLSTVEDHRARLQEMRLYDAIKEVRVALGHDDLSVAHDALAEIVRLRMLNAELVEALEEAGDFIQPFNSADELFGKIDAALAKAKEQT